MTDPTPPLDPDAIADEFGIESLGVVDGVATLTTTPTTEQSRALVLAMSLACGKMLDDDQATNYVEFEVSPAGHPGYIVHVRRGERPSPHDLRKSADARVAELEARVAELEEQLNQADNLEFVNELPPQQSPRSPADYDSVAAKLRADGRWAKLPARLATSYTSTVSINRGIGPHAFRGGEFEAATRNGVVFLRYIGKPDRPNQDGGQ